MYIVWSHEEIPYTQDELKKLHHHFFHPKSQRLYSILRRANPEECDQTPCMNLRKSRRVATSFNYWATGPADSTLVYQTNILSSTVTSAVTSCPSMDSYCYTAMIWIQSSMLPLFLSAKKPRTLGSFIRVLGQTLHLWPHGNTHWQKPPAQRPTLPGPIQQALYQADMLKRREPWLSRSCWTQSIISPQYPLQSQSGTYLCRQVIF